MRGEKRSAAFEGLISMASCLQGCRVELSTALAQTSHPCVLQVVAWPALPASTPHCHRRPWRYWRGGCLANSPPPSAAWGSGVQSAACRAGVRQQAGAWFALS